MVESILGYMRDLISVVAEIFWTYIGFITIFCRRSEKSSTPTDELDWEGKMWEMGEDPPLADGRKDPSIFQLWDWEGKMWEMGEDLHLADGRKICWTFVY